jgi:xanthine/uracil permease
MNLTFNILSSMLIPIGVKNAFGSDQFFLLLCIIIFITLELLYIYSGNINSFLEFAFGNMAIIFASLILSLFTFFIIQIVNNFYKNFFISLVLIGMILGLKYIIYIKFIKNKDDEDEDEDDEVNHYI